VSYPINYDESTAASSRKYPLLRFDAFSMLDLLKAKLSENKKLTDYLYAGSNLSILLDLISEMYACLMFNLNNAASESMLSDTRIYSNLNRLVKFLGYSPAGFKASNVMVDVTSVSFDRSFLIAPKYSTITLDRKDGFGNNIVYSTVDYSYINGNSTSSILLYNGSWKHYNQTFTATGEPNEKFILSSINISGDANEFVAFPFIDVYVKRPIGNSQYKTILFSAITGGMYSDNNGATILKPTSNNFNLRLNEYKQYEIEFGDGIHGSKLKDGDIVHVVYLQSNGEDGEIDTREIDNNQFKVKISGLSQGDVGTSTLTLNDIFEIYHGENNSILVNEDIIGKYEPSFTRDDYNTSNGKTFFYGCTNLEASSTPSKAETVDQIRTNAPNWFKRIGRTITVDDFTTYIKERFYADIVDCVVMNNYKYMSTFYKWLWFLGKEKLGNPKKWINPSLNSCGTYGYKFADASDSNNVYVWIKQEIESTTVGRSIITELQNSKMLTAEPVVVSAVDEKFAICAGFPVVKNDDGTYMTMRDFYNANRAEPNKPFVFDDKGQNRLEIEMVSGSNISASVIKDRVLSIFKNFFSTNNMNIGDVVNIGDLQSEIMSIDCVKRVRTIFRRLKDDGTFSSEDIIIRNGICLAHWNDSVVDGYDIDCTNSNVVLEEFQFPVFNDFQSIIDHIDVVVNGSTSIVNIDEY
jgi:hypothetical protein